jgi:hypothetical protein
LNSVSDANPGGGAEKSMISTMRSKASSSRAAACSPSSARAIDCRPSASTLLGWRRSQALQVSSPSCHLPHSMAVVARLCSITPRVRGEFERASEAFERGLTIAQCALRGPQVTVQVRLIGARRDGTSKAVAGGRIFADRVLRFAQVVVGGQARVELERVLIAADGLA